MDGFGTLIDKGYCATYDELKHQYEFGNVAWCKAVLSPFINENFDPQDYARGDVNPYDYFFLRQYR